MDKEVTGSDTYSIGRRRVKALIPVLIKQYPEEDGFLIRINRIEGTGLDVVIEKNGVEHTVIEITNWSKSCRMSKSKFKRYKRNFNKYSHNVTKRMIASYPINLSGYFKKLRDIGVNPEFRGYQD